MLSQKTVSMIENTLQIVLKIMKHQTVTEVLLQNFTPCKRDKTSLAASRKRNIDIRVAPEHLIAVHKVIYLQYQMNITSINIWS